MFQKEVADRIISKFNNSNYGRLSILSSWKLKVKKILDIKPQSFSPRPKIDSSLLLFTPKENFFELKDPKNLEKITRIFFSQRRKDVKKTLSIKFLIMEKKLHKNLALILILDLKTLSLKYILNL